MFATLWTQHRFVRLGEDVPERRPEPESAVPDGDDGGPHAPVTQVTKERRPGVGRLPVAIRDGDELLLAVEADAHDDETAQPLFVEADGEVHPVDPDVDVAPVREAALHEGAVLGLPGRRQPGNHRW